MLKPQRCMSVVFGQFVPILVGDPEWWDDEGTRLCGEWEVDRVRGFRTQAEMP